MDDVAVGAAFRMARIRRGWRQIDVANRCGRSQSTISRLECGTFEGMTLDDLRAIAAVLEIRLELRLRWRGAELDRLVGGRHSSMHELVAGLLRAHAFEVAPEVSFNHFGERGVIDALAWHPVHRCLLVVELKTDIVDINDLLATMDRRRRLAPLLAQARGWAPEVYGMWVVVAESRTNRRRVELHRSVLRSVFPEDGRSVRGWLDSPSQPASALWFLTDTRPMGARQELYLPRRVRTASGRPNPT